MKKTLTLLLAIAVFTNTNAQTLFTYGNHAVNREEFLRAFNKNNTGSSHSEKDIRDYLTLFTRFKLKVQAAYDERLDTLPGQVAEFGQFRNQLAEGFLSDEHTTSSLVGEAFERSRKDLHLAHIFIPTGTADTTGAWNQVTEAWKRLKKGADFGTVAAEYSKDPSAKYNKGDIGYITVFTLPYDLETLAYNTPPGKFSRPYHSRVGYHIFKILSERRAAGKMKAAQILLAFKPGAGDNEKAETKKRADSLYALLQQGASFSELALTYSNDNTSYQAGGLMPEFGVGRFAPDFENAVFALKKDGDISRPIPSAAGYHIIERIEGVPVNTDKNNASAMAALKLSVLADSRIETARKVIAEKMIREGGYQKAGYNQQQLWLYMDSVYRSSIPPQREGMNDKTVLFSFPGQSVTAADLSHYLKAIHNIPNLTQGKSMPALLQQYTETVAGEYYRSHLENFNKEFALQAKEFRDGNLLFEIMQRRVWDKAATDSAGLNHYYNGHKDQYWWGPSADIILFTCSDSAAAVKARAAFSSNKTAWKDIAQNSDGTVQADSARYELAQLPVGDPGLLQAGYLSSTVKTSTDNVTTFLYVINRYPNRSPRSFEEARGFVINDYQAGLEEKWINDLVKKYPVKINEAVLKTCWK